MPESVDRYKRGQPRGAKNPEVKKGETLAEPPAHKLLEENLSELDRRLLTEFFSNPFRAIHHIVKAARGKDHKKGDNASRMFRYELRIFVMDLLRPLTEHFDDSGKRELVAEIVEETPKKEETALAKPQAAKVPQLSVIHI